MSTTGTIPVAQALELATLIAFTPEGIASRVLAKNSGGSVTLFAFDAGEGLSEHTTPYDALAITLDGALTLTVGGAIVPTTPGTIVRLPASVPHAIDAPSASRMLLIMLKDAKPA